MNYNMIYKAYSDDELQDELIKLTNDGYLCTREELNENHHKEKRRAVWDELLKRGLAHRVD